MFKRILVPVDLGTKSAIAVEAAFNLARQSETEVFLLHVIETIEHVSAEEMRPFYERLATTARKKMEKLSEKFEAANLPVHRSLVYGHRTGAIIDFAAEQQTDLIVMASHRIDPNQRERDWDTISYAVAFLSPCPVLLVK